MTKLIKICALGLLPSVVLAEVHGTKLSEVVSTLAVGGDVLSKVMWAASIIVGIALIAAGFTQFQIHRRNPKLVPLTTPVMYLILGVAAVAIPFVERINDFMDPNNTSKVSKAPRATKESPNINDIDAPLN